MSYLQQKGVQVSQFNNFGNLITKSHSAKDFVRNVFDPVSALGAFAVMDEQYKVAELLAVLNVESIELHALNNITNDNNEAVLKIFFI